jgi:hypothetical protein
MSDLRRLAEQATPGPWVLSTDHGEDSAEVVCMAPGDHDHLKDVTARSGRDGGTSRLVDDCAFIAACDPQTILTLLDERDRYREALEFILGEFDDADFEHDPVPTTARDALGPEAAWIDAGSARRREECDGCGRMMQADEGFETDDGGVWCADCRATAIATRALEGG